jgi:hypothetical protein
MFTGVVRQHCQSCLFPLSNWRASAQLSSAHFGSTWHGMEKTAGEGGGCLPSDAPSTSQYVSIYTSVELRCEICCFPAVVYSMILKETVQELTLVSVYTNFSVRIEMSVGTVPHFFTV